MNKDLRDTVLGLAKPLIEAQSLELWGLDIHPGPVLQVRLYVDGPAGESDAATHSATIEQCEAIARQLGAALDVEDCIDQPWNLEVSSPGLERKFYDLNQLKPFIGDIVDVRLASPPPDGGRKSWRGKLLAVNPSGFAIQPVAISQDGVVTPENLPQQDIPWLNIARVARVHIFSQPQKPGKQAKKA